MNAPATHLADDTRLAEFTALTLRFNNVMARHMRVLVQINHAAKTALADEQALGFPLPYADFLQHLADTSHDCIEEINQIVQRRSQEGRG